MGPGEAGGQAGQRTTRMPRVVDNNVEARRFCQDRRFAVGYGADRNSFTNLGQSPSRPGQQRAAGQRRDRLFRAEPARAPPRQQQSGYAAVFSFSRALGHPR